MMRNALSVALTTLSVEELCKMDVRAINLLLLPPMGKDVLRPQVPDFALQNICHVAGDMIDEDETAKLFLCDDSGNLKQEGFDFHLFDLLRRRILFVSKKAFCDPSIRYKFYSMHAELLLLSCLLDREDEAFKLNLSLSSISSELGIKAACAYSFFDGKCGISAWREGHKETSCKAPYWEWAV